MSCASITTMDQHPTELIVPDQSTNVAKSKRTRKRFTQGQLLILEDAYLKKTHPTREMRETIAQKAGIAHHVKLVRDFKSVTIWFQNKRQIQRKALDNSTNRANSSTTIPLASYSSLHHSPVEYNSDSRRHFHMSNRPLGPTASLPDIMRSRTTGGFLSLDRIATRAELSTRLPRTPTKLTRHASYADLDAVLDAMPSSPVQPLKSPCSPFSRDILDYASKHSSKAAKRSLEWACAAARFAEKTEQTCLAMTDDLIIHSADTERMTTASDDKTEYYDTEVEDNHEAITPDASQADMDWDEKVPSVISVETCSSESPGSDGVRPSGDVEDIMTAAYALCGLSRS